MTGFLVSASTGVMNSLLCKLATLLGDEYMLLKGVRKEIGILKDELSSMNSLLQNLADNGELDIQRKEWKDKVRELAFDIEDCIDIFMHRLHPGDDDEGLVRKTIQKIKLLRARHQIALQIQELKSRVVEESSRRDRYKLDVSTSGDSFTRIDPRLTALYAEAGGLVGMESPRDQIVRWMVVDQECEDSLTKQLKVVSILGFGGVGKTTLANQVYCKIKGEFQHTAFVSMSQKPNLCEILGGMLCQIMGFGRIDVPSDERNLIDKIRACLTHKRYLVVVDDIWSTQIWDIIRCAFVQDNNGSRVITTTRIEQVAKVCCSCYHDSVYKMKPLNAIDSRKLFFKRIFGSENGCPEQYKEVSQNILKKCGGVPLAIISIASLLASQENMHKENWENIQKSLLFEMELPTFECLRHVLNLSYNDLSHSLKTCFLYLGIYPEDYKIEKAYLLRRWIAEGFVSHKHGLSPEEVAETYFNDLINRSMIQPAGFEYAELIYCQVHDVMLDFILSKSTEENFITIMDDQHCNKGALKVRRLCLQSKNANIATASTSLSQIRSFTIFQYSGCMPSFSRFGLLRVLDLYMDNFDRTELLDLSAICKLFQLRYLRSNSHQIKLPKQIGELKLLETLDIRDATVTNIPSDLPLLQSLRHLTIPDDVQLPNGLGKLSELRTLGYFNLAENSIDNIRDIGELTNLRELDLICTKHVVKANGPTEELKRKFLIDSLGKLSNLRSFYVSSIDTTKLVSPTCDFLSCWFPTPLNLQRLSLGFCTIFRVPEWISQLNELTSLKIRVKQLTGDAVELLGRLPCLFYIDLSAKNLKQDLIFHRDAYPSLREFGFAYTVSNRSVTFEPSTMPKLQVLHLGIYKRRHEQESGSLAGIEHLLSLEKLKARIYCPGSVGLSFRNSILRHPRSHTFNILFPRY